MPAEEFVVLWQGASTLEQIAEKMDCTKQYVSIRACDFRKRGIPLRNRKQTSNLDVKALAALAKKHAHQDPAP